MLLLCFLATIVPWPSSKSLKTCFHAFFQTLSVSLLSLIQSIPSHSLIHFPIRAHTAPGLPQTKTFPLPNFFTSLFPLPNPAIYQMSQRRIMTELAKLKSDPNAHISAEPIADEIFHLRGKIEGPSATPYEGGTFIVDIRLPYDYPLKPPECSFVTKVHHPNISARGEICLDILKKGWNPGQSIAKVLNALLELLAAPDTDNALQAEVAYQYNTDRAAFDQIAKQWTETYARQH
jgi:ubiquitin-protein ligase